MAGIRRIYAALAFSAGLFFPVACTAQIGTPPSVEATPAPIQSAPAKNSDSIVLEAASVPEPEITFEEFEAQRAEMALALTAPISHCVVQTDTGHPAFHGCIDWHSSVHATWALVAYTRLTGDPQYVPIIEETLAPALVEAERTYMNGHRRFEMPYGRAWFLRLAMEHQKTFGDELLIPMGDDMAASMVAYYDRVTPKPISRNYDSASWALVNLHEYATWRGDADTVSFVEAKVREHFLDPELTCPFDKERDLWSDFIGVCANWAWLVQRTLPPEEAAAWIEGFMPEPGLYEPVTRPRKAHHNGQNFSRAWGFWAMYEATGDERYRDAYLNHIWTAYSRPETWSGDYYAVAHWVAQFGMLALVRSAP